MNILMFALIFSKIMGAKLSVYGAEFEQYGYSIYLICGIVPWMAFSSTVLRVTGIFRDKAGLIGKVQTSLLALPVYIVLSEAFICLVSFGFFAVFLLLIGFPIGPLWLVLPVIFIIQQLLAFAIGFVLAVLSVFIEDIRELMPVLVQFWFWFTPIVYVVTILPEGYGHMLKFNPFYHLANAYREVVLLHTLPNMVRLSELALLGLLILAVGVFLQRKLERDIRDFV